MKSSVLKSRRFWTAIVTLVVNIVVFVVSHYVADAQISELLLKVVLPGVDTVAGILIAAYTVEDVALIKSDYEKFKSDRSVEEAKLYASEYSKKE